MIKDIIGARRLIDEAVEDVREIASYVPESEKEAKNLKKDAKNLEENLLKAESLLAGVILDEYMERKGL